ncbi:hypothetical protein DRO53_00795 [Candidatus Bathyarchaeota archaeon]|nr:MAG: hypothetical protein DRO53_00795 [Candidatus Bathyarchaeota archaeon]
MQAVSAQLGYQVEEATLTVYRDGVVAVALEVAMEGELASIRLPLLGTPEAILVLDEEGSPIDFTVEDGWLKIYLFGASNLKVYYQTQDLTSKRGTLWTLSFVSPWKTRILLPSDAYVTDVNVLPEGFTASEQNLLVEMPPGEVELSYVLEPTVVMPPSGGFPKLYLYVGAILSAAITLSAILWFRRRRKRTAPPAVNLEELLRGREHLRPDDRELLGFLVESGGQAFEAEIRSHFRLPKTTVWRMIKRLEREGLVEVSKVGGQNLVKIRAGETGVPEGS